MSGEERWWNAVLEYEQTPFWHPFKRRELREEAEAAMDICLNDNERRYPEAFAYMREWRKEHPVGE